mgnify:CR=1 FL=1
MKRVITESALKQRIKRKLARDGEQLITNRSPRAVMDLGKYMVIDIRTSLPRVTHLGLYDLVDLAIEEGVIEPFEAVEFDDGTVIECAQDSA